MSSAGYKYMDDSGLVIPDTSDLQTEVIDEFKLALRDDKMPTNPSTTQGALIVAETVARANVLANNAAVANQINPNYAGGIFLEALCRLTGLEPPAGTPTVITGVAVTGVSSTVIPALSLVKPTNAADAPLFQTISPVTIMGGVGVVDLQAVLAGPAAAPSGSWVIVSNVLGWETITNTAGVATIGTGKLTDSELRTLRANTLALQGIGLAEATTSALNDTPGVQSLQFRENVAGTTQVIDGISLVAHSIWVCVSGGTDADVAAALLNSKSLGCNWNGSTIVNVTDAISGQIYPVHFDRPTVVPVWVRVTLKASTVTGDPSTLVTNAILNYQAGLVEGMPGFTVGADVSPFELAAACAVEISGIFITKVEVSLDGSSWQTTEIDLAINQIAAVTAGRISALTV